MDEHLEQEVFVNMGSARNASTVDKLLRKYRDIIFQERNKTLLSIQAQHDAGPRVHPVKKGARSHLEIALGDIVLVDQHDGQKLRLGRVTNLNENKTTATVLVGGKPREKAVSTLRLLSIFRK